ncbi:F0F1 ATP synthase subunit alpha, partial [candidate division KSB1 bacterium]|nr:F0F1 ATP synthase subunit alpha [candidate division KSB1 bacterium]
MEYDKKQLTSLLDEAFKTTDKALEDFDPDFRTEEVGTVVSVGEGIARVEGLRSVRSDELLKFSGNQMGVAFNLDPDEIGVILLDQSLDIEAGSEVRR